MCTFHTYFSAIRDRLLLLLIIIYVLPNDFYRPLEPYLKTVVSWLHHYPILFISVHSEETMRGRNPGKGDASFNQCRKQSFVHSSSSSTSMDADGGNREPRKVAFSKAFSSNFSSQISAHVAFISRLVTQRYVQGISKRLFPGYVKMGKICGSFAHCRQKTQFF